MMMLITGLLLGVIIGVMFGMIVNPNYADDAEVPAEHNDRDFDAVCRDNLRLINLNNELQAKLAVAEDKIRKIGWDMPWLDTSLPYEQEVKKNA